MTPNRLICLALLAAPLAFAQTPTPPAPPSPPTSPSAPPRPPRDMSRDRGSQRDAERGGDRGMERGGDSGMEHRGSMGIVPPGTWWKSPEVITRLSLTADQQKRMDDILLQSRIQLIHMKASLEEEQLKLEPLLNANPVDSARSLAQISRIADLRADLEKANARMLLGLRGVLTADQWTRLHDDQHAHRQGAGRPGGPPTGEED